MGSSAAKELQSDTVFNRSKFEICANQRISGTYAEKILKIVINDHPLNDGLFHTSISQLTDFMADALQEYAALAVENYMHRVNRSKLAVVRNAL